MNLAEDEPEDEVAEPYVKSPGAKDDTRESSEVDIDGPDDEKATGDSRGPSPKVMADDEVGSQ